MGEFHSLGNWERGMERYGYLQRERIFDQCA